MTAPVDTAALRALVEKATKGPWKRIAMGGSSTVVAAVKPGRNDTRIPGYGYKDDRHCIAYPFLEDGGNVRWDFVCFSHDDAELIERARNVLPSLLDEVEGLRARVTEVESIATLSRSLRLDAEAEVEALREALGMLPNCDGWDGLPIEIKQSVRAALGKSTP